MPLTAQDIFNLPDRKRRKLHLIPKKRGKYRKVVRPKRSRDELVAFLRERGIHSTRQLEKMRQDGDPILSDYRLAFDRWSEAVALAFGRDEKVIPSSDPEYMAKLAMQFNVTSVARYFEVRRLRPDIVPSYGEVKRKWGGFRGLKFVLRRYSLAEILNSYLALRRKLGRRPSMDECHGQGILLEKAQELFGNRKKLDDFLDSLGGTG